jgi:hypothetical protein
MKRALASVDRAARFAPPRNDRDETGGKALSSRERVTDALRESENRYRRVMHVPEPERPTMRTGQNPSSLRARRRIFVVDDPPITRYGLVQLQGQVYV